MGSETEVSWQLTLVLALKFLQAFGYYGLSIVLTSFLTDDFGATDLRAGSIYGLLGMLISIFSLLTGPIIDRIGMRNSLIFGGILVGFSRVVLAFTHDLPTATFVLCTTLPFGESFGIPVLSKAVGASSTDESRKFGYGLFYTAMNVAVLFVGPTIDAVRTGGIAEYANSTPYRVVAVMCACCGFLSSAVAWSLMKGIDHKVTTTINSSYGGGSGHGSSDGGNNGDGSSSSSSNTKTTDIAAGALEVLNGKGNGSTDCTDPDNRNSHNSDFGNATTENSSSDASDSIDVRSGGKMKGTPLWTPVFRRFLTMVLLLSGVRTMFRHLDATLPKYITRAFGADAPFGKVYAINPAIIIILVPLLSSLGGGTGGNTAGGGGGGSGGGAGGLKASPSPSRRGVLVRCCRAVPGVAWVTSLHALDSIMLGATVSTCSVLFLVFGGDTHTSLAPAAMFVATLSFGEALWSPQFYSYTYEIAPDGQEGRYFALGNVPLFLPKLLAGILSGWALEEHCTVEDCSEGSKLWGLIFWSVAPFTAAYIVLRVVGFLHK